MDRLDFNKQTETKRAKSTSRSKSSKGKWREIEEIRDKIELEKELQELDMAY